MANELARDLLTRALPFAIGDLDADFPVTSVTADSRKAGPGSIFVAIAGENADGIDYAREAVDQGAAMVITYRRIDDLPCPQLVLPDTRLAAAKLAAAFYGLDEVFRGRTKLFGVTGTNGKTTVTYVFQHICSEQGIACARFGTVEYDLLGECVTATHTTPEPIELCRLLAKAVDNGAEMIAMEVSSHALSQARVAGLHFTAAAFTNLSGDHLDYHHTMDEYFQAKLELFKSLDEAGWSILNIDDEYSDQILTSIRSQHLTYGLESSRSQLRIRLISLTTGGSEFDVHLGDKVVRGFVPLIGRHNVYNVATALAAAVTLGLDLERSVASLKSLACVPGRLERVSDIDETIDVFVDYAHTDDGLANVLEAVRSMTGGSLVCVFGCGGDRDRSKRSRMAAVAERLADRIVVTSDNPRTEQPAAIIADIVEGFSEPHLAKVRIIEDRREAIRSAIQGASAGDVVVIAGKGHEDYQIIGTEKRPFDDRQEARKVLAGVRQV